MRSLVFWSGGPDSTLSLLDALRENNDDVIAINIALKCGSGKEILPRWQFELSAVRSMHRYISELVRPFVVHYTEFKEEPYFRIPDMMIFPIYAAGLCNFYKDIRKIWVGDDVQQDDGVMDKSLLDATKICIYPKRFPETILDIEYHPAAGKNRTKQQIREQLGEVLWAMSWSCRSPSLTGQVCWNCESCKERLTTHA